MMMEDLIPLEDEVSLENYRESLSMSNIGGTKVVDRMSSGSMKVSFRSRGESSGLPLPNSTTFNTRSKSVTSSTSSEPLSFDDLHLSASSCDTKRSCDQNVDIFANEILVPTVAPEPPRLHSVWSTDFEDSAGSHKSLPRSASSPDVRNSAGLKDLLSSSGLSPHTSLKVDSAFQTKPLNSPSGGPSQKISTNIQNSNHKKQQPSFLDDDDLFDFLTSNPLPPQSSHTPSSDVSQSCPPRTQSKRLVLDNEKFILRR